MRFKEKVVLVTGSSRGLGKEIVYDFAREGAKVVINYNNSYDEAVCLKKKLEDSFSSEVLLVKCDVSREEEVKEMIDLVGSSFGKIDILVNNAGICNDTLFLDKTYDDFVRVLGVNLIGTYLVSKYASKYMKKGSIINIASDCAINNGYPESCEYDASKAGVISLTHNMAKAFAPLINVNCVCPGWIDTDMNRELDDKQKREICSGVLLGRMGNVSEVSKVALFLASEDASYVNDAIIKVNGGDK